MRISMVLTPAEVAGLKAQGIQTSLIRNKAGRTARHGTEWLRAVGCSIQRLSTLWPVGSISRAA
jgi:hypothetical protein